IGGGIFSLVITAVFLNFWRPRNEWHFVPAKAEPPTPALPAETDDGHSAAAAAVMNAAAGRNGEAQVPLNWRAISLAWAPCALMSVLLLARGWGREREGEAMGAGGSVRIGPIQTNYMIPVPTLDRQSHRDPRLHVVKSEEAAAVVVSSDNPLSTAAMLHVAH